MRVLLTGATGFIGSHLLRRLSRSEHLVRALVRPGSSERLAVRFDNLSIAEGDIGDAASLEDAAAGCDAVIHAVGILREDPKRGVTFERIHSAGTRNVALAAHAAGVRNFVLISANGASPNGVSRYQTTKWEAEKTVESAGFEQWTIFRPSVVFGKPDPGRPEFTTDLVRKLIKPFPVLPVFGDGTFRLQPVSIHSLSEAVSTVLEGRIANSVFEVAGPESFPYVDILDILTVAMGSQPKPKIQVPVPLVSAGVAALGWTGLLPITLDELNMLIEGNTCDSERFHSVFGLEPIPFNVENLSYLAA